MMKNLDIKKNRLELLQMFCKTYNNFIDFSKVEGGIGGKINFRFNNRDLKSN